MNLLTRITFLLIFTFCTWAQSQNIIRVYEERSVKAKIDDFLKLSDPFAITNSQFEREWLSKYALTWTDKFKRSARTTLGVKYNDLLSKETLFKFRSNKFDSVKMMIYNQGDEGSISQTKFTEKVRQTVAKMQEIVGKKPIYKPNAGASGRNIYFWVAMPYLYRVEFSSSMVKANKFAKAKFKPEYIRLVISKGSPKINAVNIDKVGNHILTQLEIKEMITKADDGSVFLEGIPMIDQGQKGYCACATTARILNYYGREVDMHDIAKLAESTGSLGTDPKELESAIKNISAKMRLNMRKIVTCYLSNNKDYFRLMDKLSRQYKKMDMTFNPRLVKAQEIKPAFKEMALKDRRFKDFEKGIKTYINRGQPLAWALQLGIVPEPGLPQAGGGHMRLITGYNDEKKTIFFSDSWGKGHEKKEMDIYSAFYISMALWAISPR